MERFVILGKKSCSENEVSIPRTHNSSSVRVKLRIPWCVVWRIIANSATVSFIKSQSNKFYLTAGVLVVALLRASALTALRMPILSCTALCSFPLWTMSSSSLFSPVKLDALESNSSFDGLYTCKNVQVSTLILKCESKEVFDKG